MSVGGVRCEQTPEEARRCSDCVLVHIARSPPEALGVRGHALREGRLEYSEGTFVFVLIYFLNKHSQLQTVWHLVRERN